MSIKKSFTTLIVNVNTEMLLYDVGDPTVSRRIVFYLSPPVVGVTGPRHSGLPLTPYPRSTWVPMAEPLHPNTRTPVHTRTLTHTCTHTRTRTHTYAHTHSRAHTPAQTRTHTHTPHTRTHPHTPVHAHTRAHFTHTWR